jgi:lipopolysaccharide export LptBFGC system permease protein LptF
LGYDPRNPTTFKQKIAILLALAFPVHFLNNILFAFGESGALPLPLAIFATPFMLLLFSLLLLERRG